MIVCVSQENLQFWSGIYETEVKAWSERYLIVFFCLKFDTVLISFGHNLDLASTPQNFSAISGLNNGGLGTLILQILTYP